MPKWALPVERRRDARGWKRLCDGGMQTFHT